MCQEILLLSLGDICLCIEFCKRSRYSSVNIVTRLQDSIPVQGNDRIFLFTTTARPGSGAHPDFYSMGTGDSYPVSKAIGA
jgi:hypothetical protein